jgi:hypothetical protein
VVLGAWSEHFVCELICDVNEKSMSKAKVRAEGSEPVQLPLQPEWQYHPSVLVPEYFSLFRPLHKDAAPTPV